MTITVGGTDLVDFNGVVDINFANPNSIEDSAGNPINPTVTPLSEQSYTVDNAGPAFSSNSNTVSIAENISGTSLVYTPSVTDVTGGVSYTLGGTDAASFTMPDATTGEVSLNSVSPNFGE